MTKFELRKHWGIRIEKLLIRVIHNEFMGIGSNHQETERRIHEIASKFNV
jgi:hypothetical protein